MYLILNFLVAVEMMYFKELIKSLSMLFLHVYRFYQDQRQFRDTYMTFRRNNIGFTVSKNL